MFLLGVSIFSTIKGPTPILVKMKTFRSYHYHLESHYFVHAHFLKCLPSLNQMQKYGLDTLWCDCKQIRGISVSVTKFCTTVCLLHFSPQTTLTYQHSRIPTQDSKRWKYGELFNWTQWLLQNSSFLILGRILLCTNGSTPVSGSHLPHFAWRHCVWVKWLNRKWVNLVIEDSQFSCTVL